MKTLVDAVQVKKGLWNLLYVDPYPVKENGEIKYYPLVLIDAQKGFIGYDNGVSINQLNTSKETIMLTEKEEQRFIESAKWKKMVFENGQEFIFPPDPEKGVIDA